ncbi:hypothetical protein llap_19076 [Limosa lapponica baueri]|uniref:Uncharacterized protein n=1 Tax=Limosa lapponica baueri TaxID=1758121 RepID=A0A2I0TA01_LIMLA|nr:hypothetical protein llap_19076 [Limosa lapponica baueri]
MAFSRAPLRRFNHSSDCTCKAGRYGNEAAGGATESRAFKRKSSTVRRKTELSASMHQKLQEFQDEVTTERHLLEEELNDVTNELNKLHAKEKKAEKLVKRLEQEIKSQALELAQMEVKLKGFVK